MSGRHGCWYRVAGLFERVWTLGALYRRGQAVQLRGTKLVGVVTKVAHVNDRFVYRIAWDHRPQTNRWYGEEAIRRLPRT